MKKHIFFLLLLTVVACQTNSVRLTPEQSKLEFQKYPGLDQSMKLRGNENTRVIYYACSSHAVDCFRFQCGGSYESPNCFKELASKEEFREFQKKYLASGSNVDPNVALEKCEATKETVEVRRKNCFAYLSLQSIETHPSAERISTIRTVARTLCDFENVQCTQNKNNFGKGKIPSWAESKSVRSLELLIPDEHAKRNDVHLIQYFEN